MASATVRISVKAKETLKKLAEQTGKKMQTVLDEAIESYRRQRLLEEANAAFAALRADKEAWAITTREKGIPLHVGIKPPEGGLEHPSFIFIKCEDVRSVARERLVRRLGRVKQETLAEVEDRLRILPGLS